MNAIQKALSDLRYRIPQQILELAFSEGYYNYRSNNVSLDEKIRNSVVRPRVLQDCNLVGGILMDIDLNKCKLIDNDTYTYVYYVPKKLTEGKSIISALDIVTNIPPGQGGSTMSQAQRVYDSYATPGYMGGGRLELIAENTVLIRRALPVGMVFLKVRVGNDENLTNIDPRSYPTFSELTTYAVESYIYNKLRVNLDITNIMAGYEASKIMDIVESYADSEEQYMLTLREKWSKVAFCNDTESHARFIKYQINPAL